MRSRPLLLLTPLLLTHCSVIADSLVDSAFDRERDKDDVRYHLRHGDTVHEAQQGAFEDQFFRWAYEM